MDISLFHRGIKFNKGHDALKIETMPAPRRILVPLPGGAKPIVQKGDAVKAGQKIIESFDALFSHSSISGKAGEIVDLRLASGERAQALIIDSDGEDTPIEYENKESISADSFKLQKQIEESFIVRQGRNAQKLGQVLKMAMSPKGRLHASQKDIVKNVTQIIVRFCDVDPHVNNQKALSQNLESEKENFLAGIYALKKITGAWAITLVMDPLQKTETVMGIADENDFEIQCLNSFVYPVFSSEIVTSFVSGKEPDTSFKSVHESGVLVVDLSTAIQTGQLIKDTAPHVSTIVTVTGSKGKKVIKARLGTPLIDIVKAAGESGDFGKIVLGGPMRGTAHYTLEYPLTPDIAAVTLFTDEQIAKFDNDSCISCGLCSMVCPMKLMPGLLSRYCEYDAWDEAQNANIFTCIECGSCAYVCPAGRPMVQYMVHAKNQIVSDRRSS